MIIFRKLRYKNFLSTGNLFTEILLDQNKNTLIVGENGSGKSTILDALTFALFGKAYRDINKPQVINTITRRDTVVEIEFSVGTTNYKIIRGLKPNIFEIYKDDILLNQDAESKDYQKIIETQILKVNFKSFCQVVVLGSSTFKPFMQLRAYDRREVIEDLLDLQIFTRMNALLKNRIMNNGHKIIEQTATKKIVEEKIKIIKEHLLEIQSNDSAILEEKRERLLQSDKEITNYKGKLYVIDHEIKEYEDRLKDQNIYEKKLKQLDSVKQELHLKLKDHKHSIDFFEKYDNCPTCTQSISDKFKQTTINEKYNKVSEIEGGLTLLDVKINEANNTLLNMASVRVLYDGVKGEKIRLLSKIESLEKYCDELEKDIEKTRIPQPTQDNSKIIGLEKELELVNQEHSKIIEEKNILAAASTLLKDGGIKAKIIKQYVPIINKLINKYLSALDFFVQFELNEEFEESIKSRFRDEFSYASFSEGEKAKINLAILFTWRAVAKLRNSINTNLLIFDETLDSSLDHNSTELFMNVIHSILENNNIFIISHKEQMIEKFEIVLRFKKNQNFSKII